MYSQSNEEAVILNFFGDRKITFLDIGANSSILSNTFALAILGNYGLCVEPNENAFKKLEEDHLLHKNVICFRCAVSDYNGVGKFYASGSHISNNDVGLLSSLNEKETQKWRGTTSFAETEVDVVRFSRLMDLSPYENFQFISIDVEGSELDILPQMNLKEIGCELLCIEFNGDKLKKELIMSYCANHGLKNLLLENLENLILSI